MAISYTEPLFFPINTNNNNNIGLSIDLMDVMRNKWGAYLEAGGDPYHFTLSTGSIKVEYFSPQFFGFSLQIAITKNPRLKFLSGIYLASIDTVISAQSVGLATGLKIDVNELIYLQARYLKNVYESHTGLDFNQTITYPDNIIQFRIGVRFIKPLFWSLYRRNKSLRKLESIPGKNGRDGTRNGA